MQTEELPKQEGKIIFTISPSSLDAFQKCPRLYFYNQNVSSFTKSTPLDQGWFLHSILEKFYKTYLKEEIPFEQRVHETLSTARQVAIEKTDLTPEQIEEVIFHAREYIDYRRTDKWTVLDVERPFSIPIFENDAFIVLLEGKIDLKILDRESNTKIVVDHKKVSKSSEPTSLTNQQYAYAFAHQELLRGNDEEVVGTIIPNVMLNTVGFQKTKKVHERMHRFVHSYSITQLGEWLKNLHSHINELLIPFSKDSDFKDSEVWPMKLASCWNCAFANYVCSSIPETREDKLRIFFGPKKPYDLFSTDPVVE